MTTQSPIRGGYNTPLSVDCCVLLKLIERLVLEVGLAHFRPKHV